MYNIDERKIFPSLVNKLSQLLCACCLSTVNHSSPVGLLIYILIFMPVKLICKWLQSLPAQWIVSQCAWAKMSRSIISEPCHKLSLSYCACLWYYPATDLFVILINSRIFVDFLTTTLFHWYRYFVTVSRNRSVTSRRNLRAKHTREQKFSREISASDRDSVDFQ